MGGPYLEIGIGIAKNHFTGRLNDKRPRGRPRQRWEDRVKTDLTEISEELYGLKIAKTEIGGKMWLRQRWS